MKFLSSPTWNFLKDISEIVSVLIFLVGGSIGMVKYAQSLHFKLAFNVLLGTLTLLLVTLSVSLLYRQYSKSKDKLRLGAVTEKVSGVAHSAMTDKPESIVPKVRFVETTFEFIEQEAKKWSNDTVLGSENLYLDVTKTGLNITFQAFYHSTNKNLEKAYYIRSKNEPMSEVIEEAGKYLSSGSNLKEHRGWRPAVIKCIDSLYETLPSKYHIAVQTGGKDLTVGISYQQGKVNKKIRFSIKSDGILNETLNRRIS